DDGSSAQAPPTAQVSSVIRWLSGPWPPERRESVQAWAFSVALATNSRAEATIVARSSSVPAAPISPSCPARSKPAMRASCAAIAAERVEPAPRTRRSGTRCARSRSVPPSWTSTSTTSSPSRRPPVISTAPGPFACSASACSRISSIDVASGRPSSCAASAMFGVSRSASGSSCAPSAAAPSALISGVPCALTMTGSRTIRPRRSRCVRTASATASTTAALLSATIFVASSRRSSATASICSRTTAAGSGWVPGTRWAVTVVTMLTALAPEAPSAVNVLRSACRPAAPSDSEAAIVRTRGGRMQSPSLGVPGSIGGAEPGRARRGACSVSGEYQPRLASPCGSWNYPGPRTALRACENRSGCDDGVRSGRRHPGAGEVRMSQGPGGDQQATESGLPDFSASSSTGLPRFDDGRGPATLGAPSERALHRSRRTMLAVIGGSVVVLAVIALILSQTGFRSAREDPGPTAYPTADRSAEGQSEYVPDPEEPEIAPPPPIFTQAPTTECTVPGYTDPAPASGPRTVRGGDLEYTLPEDWGTGWYTTSLPSLTEIGADARNIEGDWYSVVNLGRVTFPEDEGGYPGLENAAVAIFQCYATTS